MNKRLIYAEDAIDAIEQLIIPEDMCVFEILSHIELAIGTLPSAQPEQPEDICGECDAWNKYKSEIKALPSEQTEHLVKESGNLVKGLVNDCISRQAAIDALCDNCDDVKAVCAHFPCKQCIAIEQLPSAQPEQIARDIATIIENEQDMRVILKNERTETHECVYQHTETHGWIPVTPETLPNLNSVVVVCGKKETWDYGTYRGWSGDIHSWQWKKNTIKHVYWWMYKADALPEQYEGEQDENN